MLLESHKRFGVLRDKLASSIRADEPISLAFFPVFFPCSSKYKNDHLFVKFRFLIG